MPFYVLCPFQKQISRVHCWSWSPVELIAKRANNPEGIYEAELLLHTGLSALVPGWSKVLHKAHNYTNQTWSVKTSMSVMLSAVPRIFFFLTIKNSSAHLCVFEVIFNSTYIDLLRSHECFFLPCEATGYKITQESILSGFKVCTCAHKYIKF